MHIMIDCETLATRPDAVVLEVGFAIFDPLSDDVNVTGEWILNVDDQISMRRRIEFSTFQWWMQQQEEARKKVFDRKITNTVAEFLEEFSFTISWKTIHGVWSHGANFDVPIIESFFRDLKKAPPWDYHVVRDTRTLFWLARMEKPDYAVPTVKHSAQADAIAQAKSVQIAMKKLMERSTET